MNKLVSKFEDFKKLYAQQFLTSFEAAANNHTRYYSGYPGDKIFECIQDEESYKKFRDVISIETNVFYFS